MDHLRLILIVIGVSLIASIYLYEVLKRRRETRAREAALDAAAGSRGLAHEPVDARSRPEGWADDIERAQDRRAAENARALVDLNDYDIDEDFPVDEPEEPRAAPGDGMIEVRARGARAAADHGVAGDEGLDDMRGLAVRRDSPEQLDLSGLELSAPRRRGEVAAADARRGARGAREEGADEGTEAAHMLIVLTVMARGADAFDGEALRAALEANGLHHGEMDIFHRPAPGEGEGGAALFSVANVVNPGTFDLEEMSRLETPGIALFMRLPGPESPGEAFRIMLDVANGLAQRLGGRVCDEARNALTSQSINHLRERIADFSRRRLLKV